MLIPYLEEAMEDEEFTAELSQLMNQINVESEKNINKDFTAKDNSVVISRQSARTIFNGGTHHHGNVPEKKL